MGALPVHCCGDLPFLLLNPHIQKCNLPFSLPLLYVYDCSVHIYSNQLDCSIKLYSELTMVRDMKRLEVLELLLK